MTPEEAVAGTFEWCSAIRVEKGLPPLTELPLGYKQDGKSCPCGAATGYHVGRFKYGNPKSVFSDTEHWGPHVIDYIGETPPAVQEFVRLFDRGDLPQFDAFLANVGAK